MELCNADGNNFMLERLWGVGGEEEEEEEDRPHQ